MTRIVFFYPSKTIGGAQLLFIRLADYISKNTNFEVFYVDYPDGFSKQYLDNVKFKYIDYFEQDKIIIPIKSCIVIPASLIFTITKKFDLKQDSFCLIWSIHPMNMVQWLLNVKNKTFLSQRKRKVVGNSLLNLYNHGYLHFMDYANYIYNASFFKFQIKNTSYLPIPVGEHSLITNFNTKDLNKNSLINIVWVGRLDKDKSNSVLLLINEIENCKQRNIIKLHIIGEGSEYDNLYRLKNKYGFEIDFKGRVYGEELDYFISNYADIGVAMGTSALEIAKLGKPVVMIDVFDKVYKSNIMKYDLLHQIENYSLGSIYPFKHGEKRQYLFNEVIDLILQDYTFLAQKSYNYIQDHHTINKVSELLMKNISQAGSQNTQIFYKNIQQIETIYENHTHSLLLRTYNQLKKVWNKS